MKTSRRHFIKSAAISAAGIAFSKYVFANPGDDYTYLNISDLSSLLRERKVSPVTITKACLERIRDLNPKLNAFITVMDKRALEDARKAENEMRKGKWRGPLHGIPIALKDNIDTAGVKTTAASGVYKDRVPSEDAVLVSKLKRAGAIIIGKTNLHEFAMGTTSHVSYYGPVINVWNHKYISGGSSGGSAVAVASGMCYAALGTDTGGSNRLPASCNGIVGFKPSYGLISTKGIIPVIQSIDHAGIFTRTTLDNAIVLHAVASGAGSQSIAADSITVSPRKITIGIVENFKATDEVKALFLEAISIFQTLGFQTKRCEMPEVPGDFMMGDYEIRAYHLPLVNTSRNLYQDATIKGWDPLAKITDESYQKQKARMIKDRKIIPKKLFVDVNVIVLPTVVEPTLTLEAARSNGPFAMDDSNTFAFNYYGLPAISIPCGFDNHGIPVGLQIVGPNGSEANVLHVAHHIEQATKWHLQHPLLNP